MLTLKLTPPPSNKSAFSSAQEQLRVFYLQDYEHILSRLKWSFYLQGDKPGKLLAARVKARQARNKISYLSTPLGHKIYDPREITN